MPMRSKTGLWDLETNQQLAKTRYSVHFRSYVGTEISLLDSSLASCAFDNIMAKDLKKNALFEQAASSEAANFSPSALAILFEKVIKNYIGQETDEVAVEKHRSTLDGKLEGYERILGKQKYIAGDEFTLADLFHLPCGAFLSVAGSGDLIERGLTLRG
ncbi:hypothetical protein M378DRAFT_15795 [Amanita muscaria Koide BX008]|uniref:glutathione transferase n=1 Tax=Amanita muscaria (strain Koide BX008) TaxID=946122 RepID=A0A0C2WN30_AMAMK|nr:hypothetical protein M378DRAFT_15795 [Amanita muscaria Koide BX008]